MKREEGRMEEEEGQKGSEGEREREREGKKQTALLQTFLEGKGQFCFHRFERRSGWFEVDEHCGFWQV
jgi:hypothetical protein